MASEPAEWTVEALERALRQRAETRRQERMRTLSQAELWLALCPAWTEELADGAELPATQSGRAGALALRELHERGLVNCRQGWIEAPAALRRDRAGTRAGSGHEDVRLYWMEDAERGDVIELSLAQPGFSRVELAACIGRIGAAVRRVAAAVEVPSAVARWAELAAAAEGAEDLGDAAARIAAVLDERMIEALVGNDDAAARRWIEAARPLASQLAGQLGYAITRASRRIELHRRRLDDERVLSHFVPLAQPFATFAELIGFYEYASPDLLRPPGDRASTDEGESGGGLWSRLRAVFARLLRYPKRADAWALHYIGDGGVGKTMLMRYLASIGQEYGYLSARIDFDHMSPDFPVRAPGLLLLGLADELRLHAREGAQIRLFMQLEQAAHVMHSRFAADTDPREDLWLTPEFARLVQVFAAAADSLDRRIVLMLDTCEELDRAHLGRGIPPAVRATFAILEQVHAKLNTVRVVFCGRRPLADAGAGWRRVLSGQSAAVANTDTNEVEDTTVSWLRLCELHGFPREDALAFLRVRREAASADASAEPGRGGGRLERANRLQDPLGESKVEEALLALCERRPRTQRFAWDSEDDAPGNGPWYNPFDLNLYVSWLEDDPALAIEDLAAGASRYVETRIVGRLPELADILPVIAVAGWMDLGLLKAIRGGEGEAVWTSLSRQEWVHYRAEALVQVELTIAERLRAWGERVPRDAAGFARAYAYLDRAVRARALGDLVPEYIDAWLRLVALRAPGAADEAVALRRAWVAIEQRVMDRGALAWAEQITARLLAPGAVAAKSDWPAWEAESSATPTHALHIDVLITRAGALTSMPRQSVSKDELAALWQRVVELTAPYEPRDTARIRARAGRLLFVPEPWGPDTWDELLALVQDVVSAEPASPAAIAAVLAAAERAVFRLESEEHALFDTDTGQALRFCEPMLALARRAHVAHPDLGAFAAVLATRVSIACSGDSAWQPAPELRAGASGMSPWPRGPSMAWLAWPGAANLAYLALIGFMGLPLPARDKLLGEPSRGLYELMTFELETDRLASAALSAELEERVPLNIMLSSFDRAIELTPPDDEYLPPSIEAIPPHFVIAWRVHAAVTGDTVGALEELTKARMFAERDRSLRWERTLYDATLAICRRARLWHEVDAELRRGDGALAEHLPLLWAWEAVTAQSYPRKPKEPHAMHLAPSLLARMRLLAARWRTLAYPDQETVGFWLSLLIADAEMEDLIRERGTFTTLSILLCLIEVLHVSGSAPKSTPALDKRIHAWCTQSWQRPREVAALRLRHWALCGGGTLSSVLAGLAPLLGPRLLAEILHDEGELLALRLPSAGAALLAEAASLYREVSDWLALAQSASLALLATARAERSNLGEHELGRLREWLLGSFEHLDANVADLPLTRWMSHESAGALLDSAPWMISKAPKHWRPWLLRFAIALASLDSKADAFAFARRMARKLDYDEPPAELVPAAGSAAIMFSSNARAALRRLLPDWLEHDLAFRGVAPAALSKAAPVTFGQDLSMDAPEPSIIFRLPAPGLAPMPPPVVENRFDESQDEDDLLSSDLLSGDLVSGDLVSGDLVSGDLVFGDLVFGNRLSGDLLSKDELVAVNPSEPSRSRLRFAGNGPVYFVTLGDKFRNAIEVDVSRPYELTGAAIRGRWSDLERLLRASEVILRVERSATAPAWEGILTYAAGLKWPPSHHDTVPHFRRMLAEARPGPPLIAGQPVSVSVVAADKRAYAFAVDAWKPYLGGEPRLRAELLPFSDAESGSWSTDARVLHLFAHAVEVRAGVRLSTTYSPELHAEGQSPASSRTSELLAASAIVRRAPNLGACLLQPAPRHEDARYDDDREQAAHLRRLGAELREAGVPVVIVAPVLPDQLAEEAIRSFAATLAESSATSPSAELALWCSRMRTHLARRLSADTREAAWDLCIYASDHALYGDRAPDDDDQERT